LDNEFLRELDNKIANEFKPKVKTFQFKSGNKNNFSPKIKMLN